MRISNSLMIFILFLGLLNAQETEYQYLSGTGYDQTVEWDFFCTDGRNSGEWTKIPVPSCWELRGFGKYDYGYDPENSRGTEKGLYKYYFQVPSMWDDEGKVIHLVFEGSMTDTEVKINGRPAGPIHQGAFYRFKYDITKHLIYTEANTLEVTVSKVSSNGSVNRAERNADYWIFGGIFRPVYLEVNPQQHIERIALNAQASGYFQADLYLQNIDEANKIIAQIYDQNGEKIGKGMVSPISAGDSLIHLTANIYNPKLWSPEFPHLYNVRFSLQSDDDIIHVVEEKFGFRTIEIRERDGVYLNYTKIKFKGINRHSFWPTSGRTLSRSLSIEDVLLMKDMNMNVVRNSHYPADKHFYEVCDSLGLMVFDELGGWHDAYDTEVGTILVKEMMYQSMNHPCVVMWINGNEGGHNHELLPLYDRIDIQKRPVIHAWEIFRNADTQHYRDYNYGVGSHYQGHDVFFPTEFLHGLYDGGHGAGMEDFWKLMWDNPLSAGGLTWDFSDEAVVRTDKDDILDSDGNHGADGVVGPYREKEGSYYTLKEVWAPVFFEHREITAAFDGSFQIENRFHFTNINQCTFTWKLAQMPNPYLPDNDAAVKGNAMPPDILPGTKGILKLKLPKNWQSYDVLYITANDPHDKEIFTWSWPVTLPKDYAKEVVVIEKDNKVTVEDKEKTITAIANGVTISVDKTTGLLKSVSNEKGSISFNNGPTLCEGTSLFKSINHKYVEDNLIIESVFEDTSVMQVVKWTVYPSGWVQLDVEYCPMVEQHVLLGINFSYPEELMEGIEWFGDGPYRVWKNRMKGNSLNVWKKEYNNTITGQRGYVYPEFQGYHSRMYWLRVLTKEQPFTIVCPDEDMFFRLFTPETPEDPYNTAPPFPEGDISFMHGIAPIGTKPLQTYRMGPMSQKNIYYTFGGTRCLKMSLYFDFRGI